MEGTISARGSHLCFAWITNSRLWIAALARIVTNAHAFVVLTAEQLWWWQPTPLRQSTSIPPSLRAERCTLLVAKQLSNNRGSGSCAIRMHRGDNLILIRLFEIRCPQKHLRPIIEQKFTSLVRREEQFRVRFVLLKDCCSIWEFSVQTTHYYGRRETHLYHALEYSVSRCMCTRNRHLRRRHQGNMG